MEYNHISMPVENFIGQKREKKVTHHIHILDSMMHELQILDKEQNQKVDDIKDKTVDLENS